MEPEEVCQIAFFHTIALNKTSFWSQIRLLEYTYIVNLFESYDAIQKDYLKMV